MWTAQAELEALAEMIPHQLDDIASPVASTDAEGKLSSFRSNINQW